MSNRLGTVYSRMDIGLRHGRARYRRRRDATWPLQDGSRKRERGFRGCPTKLGLDLQADAVGYGWEWRRQAQALVRFGIRVHGGADAMAYGVGTRKA